MCEKKIKKWASGGSGGPRAANAAHGRAPARERIPAEQVFAKKIPPGGVDMPLGETTNVPRGTTSMHRPSGRNCDIARSRNSRGARRNARTSRAETASEKKTKSMAKTGIIALTKGDETTAGAEITPPSDTITTLGSVASAALKGAVGEKTIVIDLTNKKFYLGDDADLLTAEPDLDLDATDSSQFVPDEPKRSTTWTKEGSYSGGQSGEVNEALTFAVKPVMTISSIVSAIEDTLAAVSPLPTDRGVIVISQEREVVQYKQGLTLDDTALTAAADVVGTQTYTASGGGASLPFE